MLVQSPLAPISYAPDALAAAVFAAGVLVGGVVAYAARWGARQAHTTRAVAEAAGQLVFVRPVDGGACTPICVPPWRPDVADAIEALRARVVESPTQSAAMECALPDRRLRLVGARVGDGDQILVSLAEAGPDVARYNQLESAALLANGVAHDLMNVLNRLVMHAEVGAERTKAAEMRTHLERIAAGSGRAAELVSLMRRYLRGERATGVVRTRVSPAAIVVEVVELLRPAMPRGMDVALSLDAAAVVLAEPVHVHQVVLNLVTNAVQALTGRPAPRVAVAVARVAENGRAPEVELVVADNGPGFGDAVRGRVFEPYVTSRAAHGGTGLGLAVVRALVVDVLGGSVSADDAPGGGARFTVRLPAVSEAGGESDDGAPTTHEQVAAGS